ncbi:glycoside hydrolase [Sphingobacterium sp. KU25419]|nr:glycoside hydrolase [Sphingobacterium sp. KU25419]
MNTRNQQGNVRNRIISYSNDGGVTWDTTFYDKNLPDPVNQGATLSWKKGKNYILAVCNAASEKIVTT